MGFGSKFRFSVYFTLLLVSAVEMRWSCLPEVLIHPCVCPDESVRCENFTSASYLEEVMSRSHVFPMYKLNLKKACMLYIPSTILHSKKTGILMVEDSALVSQPKNSLRVIVLLRTRLMQGIQWDLFRTLTKLDSIHASHVEVRKVGKSFRTHVSKSLTTFILRNSKTKRILGDAFQDMEQLKYVEITECQLSTLQRSMFAFPSKIRVFYFNGNQIQSLPEDMFDGMPDLREVSLGYNKITFLPEVTFARSSNGLPHFKMPGTSLVCNCSMQWIVNRIVDGYAWRTGMIAPKVQIKEQFWGQCSTPIHTAGRWLKNLTVEDFHYCQNSID